MRKDQMLIKRNTEHKMQHAKFSRFGNYLPLPAVREEGIYRRKENWKMVISEGKKIEKETTEHKKISLYIKHWIDFQLAGNQLLLQKK